MLNKRNRRPQEAADDIGYKPLAPEASAYGGDSWPQDTQAPYEEERVEPFSVFKPRLRQPNFILCVLVNVVRILFVLILVGGLALAGAVVGIAKGYVETAPSLDLTALDAQAQTTGQILGGQKPKERKNSTLKPGRKRPQTR